MSGEFVQSEERCFLRRQKDMMRLIVSLIIQRLRLKTYQHPQGVNQTYLARYWRDMVITNEPSGPTKTGAFFRPGPQYNEKKKTKNKNKKKNPHKQNRNSCFVKNLQQFCNIYENSPATSLRFCHSTESRRRSLKITRLQFSTTGNFHYLPVRCCATNRKVASSIPAGVIGIFH